MRRYRRREHYRDRTVADFAFERRDGSFNHDNTVVDSGHQRHILRRVLRTSSAPALLGTVTATAVNPRTLTAGATYFWRVVAKSSGSSAGSSTFSFTVASTSGGGTGTGLTLLSPADGATGVSF